MPRIQTYDLDGNIQGNERLLGTDGNNDTVNVSINSLSDYIANQVAINNETDPVFIQSAAFNITSLLISQWNAAYNWGNHANAGYLQSFTETDPVFLASQASNITAQMITDLGNLSGVNTGDQDLSALLPLSGGVMAGNLSGGGFELQNWSRLDVGNNTGIIQNSWASPSSDVYQIGTTSGSQLQYNNTADEWRIDGSRITTAVDIGSGSLATSDQDIDIGSNVRAVDLLNGSILEIKAGAATFRIDENNILFTGPRPRYSPEPLVAADLANKAYVDSSVSDAVGDSPQLVLTWNGYRWYKTTANTNNFPIVGEELQGRGDGRFESGEWVHCEVTTNNPQDNNDINLFNSYP